MSAEHQERNKRWIEIYESGKSLREIAAQSGVSFQCVQQYLKKYIQLRAPHYWHGRCGGGARKYNYDSIAEDRRSGMTYREITEKHGCSEYTARCAWKQRKAASMPQTNDQRKGNWATDHEAAARAKNVAILKAGKWVEMPLAQMEAERRLERLTVGMQGRDLGTIEYEGQEFPVLWRRGGTVCFEISEGIRKEVEE